MTKPASASKIPSPPRPKREPLTKKEQTYLAVLVHWYKHRDYAPSCDELADLCRPVRSYTAVRSALLGAERKGYCRRNSAGRFEVLP